MADTSWCYSRDEEWFEGDFATREDAIAAAPDELGLEPGQTFFIARSVPVPSPLTGEWVVEKLREWEESEGEVPDRLEGEFPDVTPAAVAELDELLQAWAKKHDVRPRWWHVADVQEHEVPEEEPAPQPIGHCPKCNAPQFTDVGFCGGCRAA